MKSRCLQCGSIKDQKDMYILSEGTDTGICEDCSNKD